MSLVLDSSTTVARVFPDECTPAILDLFHKITNSVAWVPELWRLEVANSLSVSVKRKRLLKEDRDNILLELLNLPIECDEETGTQAWGHTLELADRHSLTVYDATYLELALRRSLPLATLDRDLRRAAQAEGITLLGL